MPRKLVPPSPERAAAEALVTDALARRDFIAAIQAVARYEAAQPTPRGMGIDWNNHNPTNDLVTLNAIYSHVPAILKGITPEAVGALRYAAAMTMLWGGHKRRWLPIDFPTGTKLRADAAARMFQFYGWKERDIARWRQLMESGMIREAEVMGLHDACAACQRLAGKRFSVTNLPELPHPECTSEKGCRCSWTPVLRP